MGRLRQVRGRVVGLAVNLTGVAVAVWWLRAPQATAVRVLPPPTVTPAPSPTAAVLQVYVTGAVAEPDVVRLPEGARARDAVAAAGGFTASADSARVNLAAPLGDGSHLHIPAQGEVAAPESVPAMVGDSGSIGASAVGGGAAANGVLNVNTATAADFEALPGIGPALAERIVAYRAEHGPFKSVKVLTDVPGIGEKTLARFAARLAVR